MKKKHNNYVIIFLQNKKEFKPFFQHKKQSGKE